MADTIPRSIVNIKDLSLTVTDAEGKTVVISVPMAKGVVMLGADAGDHYIEIQGNILRDPFTGTAYTLTHAPESSSRPVSQLYLGDYGPNKICQNCGQPRNKHHFSDHRIWCKP